MPQNLSVLDSTGATQTVSLPTTAADNGRAAAASSRPVALSTEDKTSLDAVTSKMEEVRALVAGTDSQLPATLGAKTGANSLSVVLASDGTLPLPTGAATSANQTTANTSLANLDADLGAPADAAASSDTGTFSLIALIKRGLQNWTTLLGRIPSLVSGRMPVDGSGVTQPVSAASLPLPTGAATEATISAMNAKLPAAGQTTMSASQPVVIASDQSTVPVNQAGVSSTANITAQNANPTTGTATANSTASLTLSGASGFAVDVRGTFTATLTFQGTVNGTDWFTINVLPAGAAANTASVSTATAAGTWFGNANGCLQVRASAGSYTSGTATVVLRAMQAVGVVLNMPAGQTTQAVSGTVTANIGTGSIAAGTNAIGDIGVQYRANNTGAASVVSVLSPATPAAATIKASAGRLLGWQLQNSSAGLRSVKVFNATAPTLGTTSATFEIDIPAGGTVMLELPGGIGFATAMTYSVTSAKGLTDNTATGLAANDVSGAFFFA